MKRHQYSIRTEWTGDQGSGTRDYDGYRRDHTLSGMDKYAPLLASSDPSFRGDPSRYNPEELLVASLSACHMLWYLHLASVSGVVVRDYVDEARGTMQETEDGGGRFTEVTLQPRVLVQSADQVPRAQELHAKARSLCFIANSCNFPILHEPTIEVAPSEA